MNGQPRLQKGAGRTIKPIARKGHQRTDLLVTIGIASLYGLFGITIMGRVFFHPQTWVLGGYGDTQQFMWYLGWFWHAIFHGQNVFYTYQINAPIGQNMMWNTSILAVSALFGWLVPLIHPITLYNELWLLNFVISCMLGRSILRELSTKELPAIVGGFLMGIMPYESSQMLFHLHLWMTAPILAMIFIFIKQYKNKKVTWRSGLLLGALAAFEFYTSLETCVTFALCAALFWIIASILKKDPVVIGNRISWGTALLITVSLCLPGVCGLFMVPGQTKGALLPPGVYVNDLFTFLVPTPIYQLHANWMNLFSVNYTGNFWENDGYIGLPAGVMILISVWALRKNRLIVASFISLVIIAILSLGPTLHILGMVTDWRLPWSVVQPLPFFRDIIPSRLMLYGDILIVLIIMLAWSSAIDHKNIRLSMKTSSFKRRIVVPVFVSLTVLSWLPSIPYDSSRIATGEDVLFSHPDVMQDLVNQRVFVLTSDQSIFMQTMADSKYQISMVNPYGYANNAPSRDAIRLIRTSFSGSDAEASELVQELPKSGATRVLYFPVETEDQIPPAWYKALNRQFGGSQISVDHVLIWNVH